MAVILVANVQDFKKLSLITFTDNNENKYYHQNNHIMLHNLSHIQLKIYTSFIRTAVTYNTGTLTMWKKDEESLNDLRGKYLSLHLILKDLYLADPHGS